MDRIILDYSSGIIGADTRHGVRPLVRGLAFTVREGESLALVGETGSGKTMTALSIMRLLPRNVTMSGGRIVLDGLDLMSHRDMSAMLGDKIVYIPQNGHEYLDPSHTVRRQLYDSLKKSGVKRGKLEAAALGKLGIAGFDEPASVIDKYPFELSGGMAQRVTIALSACSNARLIIADEPTNGLDSEGRARFDAMLKTLFPQAAKLIITHDIGVAANCDRVLVMLAGQMMEQGDAAQVLTAPRHPYTRALIGALVQNGMHETPTLRAQRGSCPFYSRCPDAGDKCLDGETRGCC